VLASLRIIAGPTSSEMSSAVSAARMAQRQVAETLKTLLYW